MAPAFRTGMLDWVWSILIQLVDPFRSSPSIWSVLIHFTPLWSCKCMVKNDILVLASLSQRGLRKVTFWFKKDLVVSGKRRFEWIFKRAMYSNAPWSTTGNKEEASITSQPLKHTGKENVESNWNTWRAVTPLLGPGEKRESHFSEFSKPNLYRLFSDSWSFTEYCTHMKLLSYQKGSLLKNHSEWKTKIISESVTFVILHYLEILRHLHL